MTIYDFLLIVIVIILCFTVMHIWKLLTEIVKWIGDNMNIKDTQIKLLQQKIDKQEETISRLEKISKCRTEITNSQNKRIENQDKIINASQVQIQALQKEITLLEEQLTVMHEKIKNDELIIKRVADFLEKLFKLKETEE